MQETLPAAIVLAAGGSRRMGRPKGALRLAGRAVLEWHVDRLTPLSSMVVVVLGAEAASLAPLLPPSARTVLNPDWESTWPADSLRLALAHLDWQGPCWVCPVDIAPPRIATLRALQQAGPPAVPVDAQGRPGHPVLLDAATVAAVRAASPVGGLRTLLSGARRVSVSDPLVAQDFDDEESFERMRRRWQDG